MLSYNGETDFFQFCLLKLQSPKEQFAEQLDITVTMAWIWTHRDFFEDYYDKELPAQIFQDEEVEHDKETKSTSKDGKYGGSVDKAHDCDKKPAANGSGTDASNPQGIRGNPTR